MEESKKNWRQKYGWIILLILIVFVLIYVIYQSFRQEEDKTKEEKERQLKLLENRRDRLRKLIELQKKAKHKLNKKFYFIHILARIIILSFIVSLALTAKFYYPKPEIEDYLTWLAFLALIFAAITYILFGFPFDCISVLKKVKPKLETYIYGKYLGIDDVINANEDEFSKIEKEIRELSNSK